MFRPRLEGVPGFLLHGVPDQDNYLGAQDACVRRRANLTSVHSEAELVFLTAISSGQADNNFWIGLQRVSGTFIWVDGTDMTSWASSNIAFKNRDCGAVTGETMVTKPCFFFYYFICKKSEDIISTTTTTSTTSTTTTTTTNVPASTTKSRTSTTMTATATPSTTTSSTTPSTTPSTTTTTTTTTTTPSTTTTTTTTPSTTTTTPSTTTATTTAPSATTPSTTTATTTTTTSTTPTITTTTSVPTTTGSTPPTSAVALTAAITATTTRATTSLVSTTDKTTTLKREPLTDIVEDLIWVKKRSDTASVPDNRPSAVGIGAFGVFIMAAIFVLVFLMDIGTFVRHFRWMRRNLKHFCRNTNRHALCEVDKNRI